jgi:GNAT superfamily N-acetyltransferase
MELSRWFDPFLPHFIREALGCGGEARLVWRGATVVGLLLVDPTEKIASVFSRSPEVAETLRRTSGVDAVYSEHELLGPREGFDIFWTRLEGVGAAHRFRHSVRIAAEGELAPVRELLREVYGGSNDRWFRGVDPGVETCFVAELGGRIVGAAWASIVGRNARLHSLTVRPGFRRGGLGTDLLFARLLWAEQAGAREALSEISDLNRPSRVVAERAGMHPVGRIYLYGKG